MTVEQIKSKTNQTVKLIFKQHDQRLPIIGKFIRINERDADYLDAKRMSRFVSLSKFQYWNDENPQFALTRIFCLDDIVQVIPVSSDQIAPVKVWAEGGIS